MMAVKCIQPKVKLLSQPKHAPAATKRIGGRQRQRIAKQIAERDGYSCRQCGRLTTSGEVDHITPLHLGGRETDDNRQYLCKECHAEKSREEGNNRRW